MLNYCALDYISDVFGGSFIALSTVKIIYLDLLYRMNKYTSYNVVVIAERRSLEVKP